MKPRSVASSQTGRRGHEVRHASIVSRYGRSPGPIHSRRSRIRLSTVSDTAIGLLHWRPARRRPVSSTPTVAEFNQLADTLLVAPDRPAYELFNNIRASRTRGGSWRFRYDAKEESMSG